MKTLDELRKKTEAKKGAGGRYFSLKDGEHADVWFLQELSEDAKNFKDSIGTAELVEVVTNPNDFRKSAQATQSLEQFGGASWTVKQEGLDRGWRPKTHLLINIAVKAEDGTWEARVLDQKPAAPSHIAGDLVEHADIYGTITDRPYRIKRKGGGTDTEYQLIMMPEVDRPEELDSLELHELSEHYPVVAPDVQEAFYLGLDEGSEEKGW